MYNRIQYLEEEVEAMKLQKQLTTLGVFAFGAGSMVSSGLFVLPSLAFQESGSMVILAYLLAGVLVLPALFSSLELSTAIPKSGGVYFFVERIMGTPVGLFAGLANWFSIAMKSSFALLGIGVFTTLISPALDHTILTLISVGACLLFGLLNVFSIKSSSTVQVMLVFILLSILFVFMLVGYRHADFDLVRESWRPAQWTTLPLTTGMVFISYGGITKIASIAEEVKDPKKSIIRGTFLAFFVVQLFYLVVITLVTAILPAEAFAASLTPITDAAVAAAPTLLLQRILLVLTAFAAVAAFITTGNAGIMSASRVPMAMSRDRLLPRPLGRLSARRNTPVISILLTTGFMIVAIVALDLKSLAKVASVFMLLLFLLTNAAVIVIRASKVENYRPSFTSPLYPVTQIIGIACYLILIIASGSLPLIITGAFILLSLILYLAYARTRVERKSAFVTMVGKLARPELVSKKRPLEDELLDILIEREEIEEDRFDTLIRDAPVLDLEKTVTRAELFSRIGEIAGPRWNLEPERMAEKLEARESEASTLLYPGVAVPHAVPHVILEGNHRFDIILVRDKYGIKWNPQGEVVYTAFILIGTKDERNFHLRCLMWIAQILQDSQFHLQWHRASSPSELRTVVLLAKRRRR